MEDYKAERKEKVKETLKRLEKGIDDIFSSDNYREYLKFLGKFHNYSFRNAILIAIQCPHARHIAGFTTWKNKFKRYVKKGETGIRIIAPSPFKIKMEVENSDGGIDEVEKIISAFKVVSVFDISQTEGDPVPEGFKCEQLVGDYEYYENVLEQLKSISPYPIEIQDELEGHSDTCYGYCNHKNKQIVIRGNMPTENIISTAIHELAHALCADLKHGRDEGEIVAESVAYVICDKLGIDSSRYSFGYVASWSSRERKLFYAKQQEIQETVDKILTALENESKTVEMAAA